MSRRMLPKQFLPLVSEHSLLQDTLLRARALAAEAPIVVSNNEHRFLVAQQLQEIGVRPAVQILEPVGRNTAPAVAVAALHALQADPQAILLVLPSDHAIKDARAFGAAVKEARKAAEAGFLVTFGVRPSHPATGYGYIEMGDVAPAQAGARPILRFVEKPDAVKAREYVASGRFLWNSGMFVFPAGKLVQELERFRPDIVNAARAALDKASRDLDFLRLDANSFDACPSDSIDYAVMEKTKSGSVVASDFGWSDVGSWSALWDIGEKDAAGNVIRGDAHAHDSSGCYVHADSRLVSLLGAKNLVVVETDDAVLVADRGRAEEVKDIVERMKATERSEHVSHSRVYRPWGYYETIDAGERFRVKRLMVKPGQALSLQRHKKRAEHWVVVSGRARVTRGEEIIDLPENQSTFIPLGAKHRLENPGSEPVFLIEVQSGSYFGEDDIERFDDRYGRG